MRVGLAYDLKNAIIPEQNCPEDMLEEYDSPDTVIAIASILQNQGHEIFRLGGGKEFINNILNYPVDIVFNISEGLGNYRSREAQVPSILEMLNIPYVGSDPLSLAVSLDKPLTKTIVSSAGIATPRWKTIKDYEDLYKQKWTDFPYPAFIKPAHEGSSKGIRLISRINNENELFNSLPGLLKNYNQPVLVEEFIEGDEITVGITGNAPPEVLGIMRILPKGQTSDFIYSLEVKRDWENLVDYECPARLDANILQKIEGYSLKIFSELGCRDFARVDFKLNRFGEPYFLEINPLAGLNPISSDLIIMARKLGQSYDDLIIKIFYSALERISQCVRK